MRWLMAGLMGLFVLGAMPMPSEAQSQTRPAAQNQRQATPPADRTAQRPTAQGQAAQRPAAQRPAAQTSRPAATASRPSNARPATASRPAATQPRSAATAPRPAAGNARVAAVPYGNRNTAAGAGNARQATAQRCTIQNGRRVCRPAAGATDRWAGGLAPAALSQRACPEGTVATNAIGHTDIIRCLPL